MSFSEPPVLTNSSTEEVNYQHECERNACKSKITQFGDIHLGIEMLAVLISI